MEEYTQQMRGELRLILSGLIVISLIIVQDLIALGPLNITATISIIAFAISIPLSAFSILIDYYFRVSSLSLPWRYTSLWIISILSAIVGIVAAFWHASWMAAVVFLISGIIGFIAYIYYWSSVKHEMEEKSRTKTSQ